LHDALPIWAGAGCRDRIPRCEQPRAWTAGWSGSRSGRRVADRRRCRIHGLARVVGSLRFFTKAGYLADPHNLNTKSPAQAGLFALLEASLTGWRRDHMTLAVVGQVLLFDR